MLKLIPIETLKQFKEMKEFLYKNKMLHTFCEEYGYTTSKGCEPNENIVVFVNSNDILDEQ